MLPLKGCANSSRVGAQMTILVRFLDQTSITRRSARWLSSACGLVLAITCVDGCSLKNTNYLSKGESNAKGGEAGSTGTGGGGTSGSSGAAGSGGLECGLNETTCPEQLECVDLTVGSPSGDTVENCGSCDTTCSVTNVKTAACEAGACKPTCNSGFADCNEASVNDGCEAAISITTACGACGRACSMAGVAAQGCAAGKCTPICLPRRADCNQDTGSGTDDGCEVDLNTLTLCGATCAARAACAATQVCNADGCGAPQGIVEMGVPFTAAAQKNRFSDKFQNPPDLTDDTLTIRLYAPTATNGYILLYVSDGSSSSAGAAVTVPFSSLNEKWTDVTLTLGKATGDFDPAIVTQVNFDIATDDTGPWANPTLIYVDSIWSSDGSVNDTFNASIGQFIPSTLENIPGRTLTWRDAMP
jgi:hypothetical protein